MGRAGQRDYVVFGSELKRAGLGDEWERAKRSGSTRDLVDVIRSRVEPGRFPDGCEIVLCAELPGAADGFAVRVNHPTFAPTFSIPLRLKNP